MSGFGFLLVVLSSAVICLIAIGACLLIVGVWKLIIKSHNQKEENKVKKNQPVLARPEALEMLSGKTWWKATFPFIRLQITSMPPSWDGFVSDLARRKDIVGGVTLVRIAQFSPDPAMFGGIIAFDVIQPGGNLGTYMYHSWNKGGFSGSKGMVFVQNDNRITHFIYLEVERFSLGGELSVDCPGGFAQPGEDALKTMMKELHEELGIEVNVVVAVPLGPIHVDAGVTSNYPELFYVVIDGKGIPEEASSSLLDEAESRMKYHMKPIAQFMRFVADNDDGLTGNIVAKMLAMGHAHIWQG